MDLCARAVEHRQSPVSKLGTGHQAQAHRQKICRQQHGHRIHNTCTGPSERHSGSWSSRPCAFLVAPPMLGQHMQNYTDSCQVLEGRARSTLVGPGHQAWTSFSGTYGPLALHANESITVKEASHTSKHCQDPRRINQLTRTQPTFIMLWNVVELPLMMNSPHL